MIIHIISVFRNFVSDNTDRIAIKEQGAHWYKVFLFLFRG
jgi:hypothetical protein